VYEIHTHDFCIALAGGAVAARSPQTDLDTKWICFERAARRAAQSFLYPKSLRVCVCVCVCAGARVAGEEQDMLPLKEQDMLPLKEQDMLPLKKNWNRFFTC